VLVAPCARAPAPPGSPPEERTPPAPASAPQPAPAPTAPGAGTDAPIAAAETPRRPLGGGGARSVSGRFGAVTSAEANATRAGVGVLEAGGNAVDAAVATAAALAVTHPSAGNLGGGGFMLVRPPGGPTSAIDFRENAPGSLTRPDFDRMIAAKGRGPAAIGVPGSVAGLLLAHRRFGKLSRERVFQPAIVLARGGHVLGRHQAALIAASWQPLRADPAASKIFGTPRGTPLPAGTRLLQSDLAGTLERVAALGEAGFYAGATAQAVTSASGGRISQADLAAYQARFRDPLAVRYRGYDIETMPAPSAGGPALAGMLAAFEALDPSGSAAEDIADLHRFLEVGRRAQAERRFAITDPDARAPAERDAALERLLDPQLLLRVPIDPEHATPSARVHALFDEVAKEAEHTTHLSVVDASGTVVALTTTLSASFGSRVVAPGTGVVLGNAVASFSSVGDNQPAPGRRTTSSMAPTLVLAGGAPVLVLGTPGGDTIPSTLALLVRRLIDRALPLDAAVDAPRLHQGFVPDEARFEPARPPAPELLRGLRALGHRLRPGRGTQGDANCLFLSEGVAYAYADPREAGGLALSARIVTPSPAP
ncbi:MAG TPA: gamma-glutamyltransferase family protein, partial [Polyangiaceae bacterium]